MTMVETEMQLRRRAGLNRLPKAMEGWGEQRKISATVAQIDVEVLTRFWRGSERRDGVLGGKAPSAIYGRGLDSGMFRQEVRICGHSAARADSESGGSSGCAAGGDLRKGIARGNHSSAGEFEG